MSMILRTVSCLQVRVVVSADSVNAKGEKWEENFHKFLRDEDMKTFHVGTGTWVFEFHDITEEEAQKRVETAIAKADRALGPGVNA